MSSLLRPVTLDDKYTLDSGHVFITGTQALVRLPLVQRRLDILQGLNTGGFISGYRGSPLGGFDQALWKASKYLDAHNVKFQPGINEDLGATAVWGSQQLHLSPGHQVDGVFGMWYGKGPGVDRTGDVLKHANFAGSSRFGGVLALAGDDHACKSSTIPHQSDYAFMDAFIPVIHPATIQDVIDLGIYGWALSRFSGLWVGFKMLSDTVDTAASVAIDLSRYQVKLPEDFIIPAEGLNLRWPDSPIEQERRIHEFKLKAVPAFVKANNLNQPLWQSKPARIGLIAVGKGYLELRQALDDFGIDGQEAAKLGLTLFKVVVSWPLEPRGILEFCEGLEEIIVVEEKRPLIESQLKQMLYHLPASKRPNIIGKTTETGELLLPSTYELNCQKIAAALAQRLYSKAGFEPYRAKFDAVLEAQKTQENFEAKLIRLPYYCSGCPHNTSTTQLPEGSRALAGIGCHYMATWIDHRTQTFTHMGGEGVPWIGAAPFTSEKHIFANLGDGTYYHSGILAIRAAVAAKVNITYKLLYNDAVAMTGGQPVDGPLTVADITRQVQAEGVRRIAVVSDDLKKYSRSADFASGTTFHHRDNLPSVQEDLKNWSGASVLIYDQTCAAEKRRRRKRGLMEDPNRRIFINESVCEGCGDCGKKSNCLSVVPIETEWGRKRAIDQSSCNKDYSCVKGFCPSFVSVIDGKIRRPEATATPEELFEQLPDPKTSILLNRPYSVFITGVGGTGVITVGALIGMAAHLEGKGCSIVDMAGLAQKGGAVVSHLLLAQKPKQIHATRVSDTSADLILGFDLVVTAGAEALSKVRPGHTNLLINDHKSITGHFTRNPDYVFPANAMKVDILQKAGAESVGANNLVEFIEASNLATNLMSDSLMTNLFLVGYALQKGLLPVSAEAMKQSIHLNGVAIKDNITAFNWGRLAAVAPETVKKFAAQSKPIDADHVVSESLTDTIQRRIQFLTAYQDAAYGARYANLMQKVREKESNFSSEQFSKATAQSLFRLMAYKDEYEVARLYTDGNFTRRLKEEFTGKVKLQFHLAPPLLARHDPKTGELQKMTFGPWILSAFKFLAKFKNLRGTKLDIFGYTAERKMERHLIQYFEEMLHTVLPKLSADNIDIATEISESFQHIRGFGHVKLKNHQEVMQKVEKLLNIYHA
ncbi:indolepyruvate ferredoxin oxidoreductase family protein [Candidatus Paracaedibacter symbiosus]|uniref:indolepyruvate ferredoxin oxidoreductase family protein n=1 Tax=Candidatus Paracaedibacter symbiosus TaxID=244582 RepID=UPI000509554A|nr:indolepyruvate ferredoxin oxidoreductase family protein [Candidatus Paracaedibacter symbiosus]